MTWARDRSLGLFRSVLSINSWQAYTRPKPQPFPRQTLVRAAACSKQADGRRRGRASN